MFSKLKSLLKKLPVPLSKNHRYDLLTKKIIRKYCSPTANCVDAGAHQGQVLDWFLRFAPQGRHFAFEPIPELHQYLVQKYAGRPCDIYNIALSDEKRTASFNYVTSNPAYSGLKKRTYDRTTERDTTIQVTTGLLDDIIPAELPVHLIKIDVEGGEMPVLRGATRILSKHRPLVIFEFGIGGSDIYGSTPEALYSFFDSLGYRIYLLDDFIRQRPALSDLKLQEEFYNQLNYYFVAAHAGDHGH